MNQQERDDFINNRLECGKGWLAVIKDLDARLSAINPDYIIEQIKEKFGGLRYYFDGKEKHSEMYPLAVEAQGRCWRICEVCGDEGELRKQGWYKTLCEACLQARL